MQGLTLVNIGLGFGSASAASAPSISAAAGTLAVTITIDGDADVTNELLYKRSTDIAWTSGGSRAGDGDITVSSLLNDIPYTFVAYSTDPRGVSTPSPAVTVTLGAETDPATGLDDELNEGIDAALDVSGETIIYKPGGVGSRSIVAIVDRQPPASVPPAPQGRTPAMVIVVKNDSVLGISSSELDTGLDRIALAVRLGGPVVNCNIVRRINEDAASLELAIGGGG